MSKPSCGKGRPLIIGLAASTRRGGNSDTLLRAALGSAEAQGAKTETIILSALSVAACIGCQQCQSTGECVLADDFQSVRDRLLEADAVILGTPAYFWGFPSPAKAFIDRNQSTGARKALAKKRGASVRPDAGTALGVLLAVAADPVSRFAGLKQTAEALFRAYEIDLWDELLVTGLFEPGEAGKSEAFLEKARTLGARLVDAIVA
ncbi:flavodoxin family protein [Candidatus Bipolaricaulota bacterium]